MKIFFGLINKIGRNPHTVMCVSTQKHIGKKLLKKGDIRQQGP